MYPQVPERNLDSVPIRGPLKHRSPNPDSVNVVPGAKGLVKTPVADTPM